MRMHQPPRSSPNKARNVSSLECTILVKRRVIEPNGPGSNKVRSNIFSESLYKYMSFGYTLTRRKRSGRLDILMMLRRKLVVPPNAAGARKIIGRSTHIDRTRLITPNEAPISAAIAVQERLSDMGDGYHDIKIDTSRCGHCDSRLLGLCRRVPFRCARRLRKRPLHRQPKL